MIDVGEGGGRPQAPTQGELRRSADPFASLVRSYRVAQWVKRSRHDVVALVLSALVLALVVVWSPFKLDGAAPLTRAAIALPLDGLARSGWVPVLVGLALWMEFRRTVDEAIGDPGPIMRAIGQRLFRFGLIAAAGIALWQFASGSWFGRILPGLVLVGIGREAHARRRRKRTRILTAAGFACPRQPPWNYQHHEALRVCQRSDLGMSMFRVADAGKTLDKGAAMFAANGHTASARWARAVAIDLAVRDGRLDEAEERVTAVESDEAERLDPVLISACAGFYERLGMDGASEDRYRLVMSKLPSVPARLRARVVPYAIGQAFQRRTDWILAWEGDIGLMLESRLVRWSAHAGPAPEVVRPLLRLRARCDELERLAPRFHPTMEQLTQLNLAKAKATLAAADQLTEAGDDENAGLLYFDAIDEFGRLRDRFRTSVALTSNALIALRMREGAELELKALDMLRAGLHVAEEDRGGLTRLANRIGALDAGDERVWNIFRSLVDEVRWHPDLGGELALWLTESLRRTTLRRALEDAAPEDDPAHARIELLEQVRASMTGATHTIDAQIHRIEAGLLASHGFPQRPSTLSRRIDLAEARAALGGRMALNYATHRSGSGWEIAVVLTTPEGSTVTRTILPKSNDNSAAFYSSACGLLDAIAQADEERHALIFRGLDIDDPVWAELADALLPPHLGLELAIIGATPQDRELLVVPDAPLAGVPFTILPCGGTPLGTECNLAFTPSLSMLRPIRGEPVEPLASLAAHLDHDLATAGAEESGLVALASSGVAVEQPDTRDALLLALRSIPPFDAVYVAAHGTGFVGFDQELMLADGTRLSALEALTLPWPRWVILASCWLGYVPNRRGVEPFGIPIACMLQGAESVIGGLAPVADWATGHVGEQLLTSLRSEVSLVSGLGSAVRMALNATDVQSVYPEEVALAVWTIEATSRPAPTPSMRWTVEGIPAGS